MPEAIPFRMREQIIKRFDRGEVSSEIAAELGVSEAAARRVRQHLRERGTLEPKVGKVGPKCGLTPEIEAKLRELVSADPDATLPELLVSAGLEMDRRTLGRWLRDRLKLPLKKSRSVRPSSVIGKMSFQPVGTGTV